MLCGVYGCWCCCGKEKGLDVPTDSDCECSLFPVAAFDYGHLAAEVGTRSIENLVRVAVVCSRRMGM